MVEDIAVKKFTFAISSPDEFLVLTVAQRLTHCKLAYRRVCWQCSVLIFSVQIISESDGEAQLAQGRVMHA